MKHYMMLSDLYGRIGQTLREHGDAPIGKIHSPAHEPPYFPGELIEPEYVGVTQVSTSIAGITIKTYDIAVENERI